MQFESPLSKRLSTRQTHDGLVITVRAQMQHFVFGFLAFWICGWTVGGLFAGGSLLSGFWQGETNLFLLFWMGGWAFGWLFAATTLLWMLTGREHLIVSQTKITKKISILALGRTRHFNPAHVTNIRTQDSIRTTGRRQNIGLPIKGHGRVAFDYGQKTISFGTDLDDAEADFIVKTMTDKLNRKSEAA
ncbi:hypothetical protein ABVF61_25580 [Roseibium sp. HPY-6]|uniref:hypothetical protein n=1 Tax=Roseibium sp. HPY-6 TaxID=3229852 RepID=UPI00338E9A26